MADVWTPIKGVSQFCPSVFTVEVNGSSVPEDLKADVQFVFFKAFI